MDYEVIIRRLAQEGLSQFGYEVTCVSDGEKAIEAHGQAFDTDVRFDVVVMDLTIPGGMGGRETMPVLRKIDPTAQVIVSSGYANDPLMVNYLEHGFVDRMAKPYRIKEMVDMVRQVMHNHQEEGKTL